MKALLDVAHRHDLVIVEDAAQAHGARVDERPVGGLGMAGGFSLQSSKNLPAGEGGLLVTNHDGVADQAASLRHFGQDVLRDDELEYDLARPLDGGRALDAKRIGSMYRGNEMAAAFARAQLSSLPERTERCQRNAERLARALEQLPGVFPPAHVPERTSVHHKFRVRIDPERGGLSLPPSALRNALLAALRAEGLEVVLWQTGPLPAQTVFQRRDPTTGFPRSREGGTNLAENYDPARYPCTKALLDGSVVLFSQSCPLIAQEDALLAAYAEAFARVWHRRDALAEWIARRP
jgi:dTDP-4-amino-4,6-dideoxygalactose transaminase